MPNAALRAALGQKEPAYRYIYDRANGSSVYQDESRRPCCYICWVPPPVVVWPNTCEQNSPCMCIGRTGVCSRSSQKARSTMFTVLLLFNFYAIALTVFANLAASDAATTLDRSNFAKGSVFFRTEEVITTVRAYVGLNYIAVSDLGGVLGTETGNLIYSWEDFCGNFTGDGLIEAAGPSDCQQCADTSESVSTLLAFSIVVSVPMIATNILRRFPNYDLNCQKTWALLASLVAVFCTFWAWFTFDRDCFDVLFRPDDATAVIGITPNATVAMSWEAGSAMVCTFCASVVHAMHFLGHLMVPTPSICYDKDEQREYEEQHKAIQSIGLSSQMIPEVEEKEENDGVSEVYVDDDELQHRVTVQETVAF